MTTDDEVMRTAELVIEFEQLLAGKGRSMQGAVLACLTAQWVCGHHPASVRPDVLLMQTSVIAEFVKSMTEKETAH